MAHLILFEHKNFGGRRRDIHQSEPSLGDFNDITSSFQILAGDWEFFVDANFQGQTGPITLGPGPCPWVEEMGIPNDSISSVNLVTDRGR